MRDHKETVWLELGYCLSGCSRQSEDDLEEEHTKHHCNYSSALVLLFCICTNRNLNAPSWWCTGITCAPVHLSPYGRLLYCLPHRKHIILYNHVFSKSQKKETKTASRICFKKKKSESAFLCGSKRNMCVPGAVVFACVKRTVPPALLFAFGGLDFCVFHSYCRLDFRCTNLPVIYRNPAVGGRASWRLRNLVFFFLFNQNLQMDFHVNIYVNSR